MSQGSNQNPNVGRPFLMDDLTDAEGLTAAQTAYAKIRRGVIFGQFAPETALNERDVAAELDMSRTPVREALQMLEQERILTKSAGGVTRVMSLDERAVRDIHACREELEVLGTRMTIDRATDQELTVMEKAMKRALDCAERADVEGAIIANSEFHHSIYELSKSGWLIASARPLLTQLMRMRVVVTNAVTNPSFAEGHEAIFQAIIARNVEEAEARTREHIAEDLAIAIRHLEAF